MLTSNISWIKTI